MLNHMKENIRGRHILLTIFLKMHCMVQLTKKRSGAIKNRKPYYAKYLFGGCRIDVCDHINLISSQIKIRILLFSNR